MSSRSMRVKHRVWLAASLAWLGSQPAFASETIETAQPSTLISDVHTFVVAEDGSLTEDDETTLRANTPAGVGEIAQRYIWFDKSTSTIDINDAYSLGADGIKHIVAPDQIREIQEPRSAGAPTFEDSRLKAVVFPGVSAGSIVHLRFHKTQSKPVIAGQFDYFVEPGRGPVEDQRLIFDLPADKPLYADARGYIAVPPVTQGGRTRYEFDYSRAHYDRVEAGSVGYAQYGDRLMVSTFPDYRSFAASYRDGTVDPSVDGPAVRTHAQSLRRQEPDARTKAMARGYTRPDRPRWDRRCRPDNSRQSSGSPETSTPSAGRRTARNRPSPLPPDRNEPGCSRIRSACGRPASPAARRYNRARRHRAVYRRASRRSSAGLPPGHDRVRRNNRTALR